VDPEHKPNSLFAWSRNGLLICTLLFPSLVAAADSPGEFQTPRRARVIIIGIDGLGGESLGRANCPTLRSLMRRGAWTLKARGVMPTVSAPNWASILTGAEPEQHGISSNGWFKKVAAFQPACSGERRPVPTIFALLRQQRPSARGAVFHEWGDFARLVEAGVPDVIEHRKGAAQTMTAALQYWRVNQPDLMFIHLLTADLAGHFWGWNSGHYLRALQKADFLIGQLLATLEQQGQLHETFILVTSDHGGSGHNHGRNSAAEIEVPWIIAGPGVPAGVEIAGPVETVDTAPTVASILGLHPFEYAVGRRVASAFSQTDDREAGSIAIAGLPPVASSPVGFGRSDNRGTPHRDRSGESQNGKSLRVPGIGSIDVERTGGPAENEIRP
jgi:hypothetical protein